MKWKTKVRKILAVVLTGVLFISMFASLPAVAEEAGGEKYPYTIFASDTSDGAITIQADNFCLNGDIATNGTIVSADNININGTKTEHAEQEMIYFFHKIDDTYFSKADCDKYGEDYILEEQNINIDTPMMVSGEINLEGNINLSTAMKALSSISMTGEVKNTDNSIIFSKYGDIIIDSTNVNLNGLLYAPFGNVEITAQNLGLNNIIIIAEKVTIHCDSVNANYGSRMAEFIGVKSEKLEIPEDEKPYLEGNDITEESSTEENSSEENTEDVYNRYEEILSDFENWEEYTDTDGDGLPDEIEVFIGSNKELKDTDEDGLNDYYEYVILGTSPLLVDTDENGTNDSDEDFDDDGLTNAEEYEYDTIAWEEDTDEDGLSDGEEVLVYKTEPFNKDTDGDGLLDGDEPSLGFNPANPDTDGNGISDGEEKLAQRFVYEVEKKDCVVKQVIVETEVSGNFERATTAVSIMDKDMDCTNVVGLVGEPFEIETTSAFETAKLTFTVDKSRLGKTDFNDLLFLWYDEQNGEFVELETAHDKSTGMVSTETNHFSKYMLVDSKKWEEAWSTEIDYPLSVKKSDTICYTGLIFDMSVPAELRDKDGKDTGAKILESGLTEFHAQINPMCAAIGKVFVDCMDEQDRTGVAFEFKKGGYIYKDDTGNKTILADTVKPFEPFCKDLWTYDDMDEAQKGLISIRNMTAYLLSLKTDEENVERRIILVTGGNTTLSDLELDFARKKKIKIDTIALGDYAKKAPLIGIANRTGGMFYQFSGMDDLEKLIKSFDMDYALEQDTDGDGIPDKVEEMGMRNQFGNVICTEPDNPDTDGDGLLDGEEVDTNIRKKKCSTGHLPNLTEGSYYFMPSHPEKPDTDGDSYSDYEEVKIYHTSPRFNDITSYKLKSDYVSVDADFDEEIDAYRDYGGNQMWFEGVNNIISNEGCGLISASDILLYLAKSDEKYATEITNKVTKEPNGKYNYDIYMAYLAYMEKEYFDIGEGGVLGTRIANRMNVYNEKYKLGLKAKWCFSENKILPRIIEMIKNDIPVTLSANAIEKKHKKEMPNDEWRKKCPQLYTNEDLDKNEDKNKDKDEDVYSHEFTQSSVFHNHYVTITGIYIDEVQNRTWLHVSSWGISYYIDFDEYINYLENYASFDGIATNILYIKKQESK